MSFVWLKIILLSKEKIQKTQVDKWFVEFWASSFSFQVKRNNLWNNFTYTYIYCKFFSSSVFHGFSSSDPTYIYLIYDLGKYLHRVVVIFCISVGHQLPLFWQSSFIASQTTGQKAAAAEVTHNTNTYIV